jgi:hypothetical protein
MLGKVLEKLSNWQVLKKDTAPWRQVVVWFVLHYFAYFIDLDGHLLQIEVQ